MISDPTPQRQLRGHLPQRPLPRAATSREHQAWLARRLTTRDRWLVRVLCEHRVLTTHQIARVLFPSVRSANKRLRELFTWRVIDRFQPFVHTGAAPMHYVLDIAGATALAHEDGLDPKKLGYRHEASMGVAHSLQLAHTIAVNGFFTTLVAHARQDDHAELTAWWSERRCRKHFGDIARPDGYGRWRFRDAEVEFFLEFDFGTENLCILTSKLRDYEKLAASTAIITPVLIRFASPGREASARRALSEALAQLGEPELVPIATSTSDSPTIAAWQPINGGPQRLRLIDLAGQWPGVTISTLPKSAPPDENAGTELAPPQPMPPASSWR